MKKFVNFRFVVTLVLAIFANVATYAQDNVVDEVVWVVGDEAILKSDVEEARMDALFNVRHASCRTPTTTSTPARRRISIPRPLT